MTHHNLLFRDNKIFDLFMIENILTYSVGSFIWGILIALACTGLILFIIKAINQDSYFTPLSYIIALILCVILAYNCTIICSAISMKSDIGFVEGIITQIVQISIASYDSAADQEVTNEILQTVLRENPILYHSIGLSNFEGIKLSELPHLLANNFYDYLNSLIWEKVLWSLLFIVVGIVLTIVTLGRTGNSNRYRSRMGNSRVSSRTSRRRPSSRKR